MKKKIIVSFSILLACINSVSARPTPVSITEYDVEPGSPDHVAIKILTAAYNKEYEKLEPYFSRTWIEWPSNKKPESAWRTVLKASDLSEIHILPSEKSLAHKDVYYVRYYVIKENGRRSGAELLLMKQDGFKLAVQANRSPIGNDYIQLGRKREYLTEKLTSLGGDIENENENVVIVTMPSSHAFRLTFSDEALLEKLEIVEGDHRKEIYLVIFDLEGTPTIKLK